MKKTTNAVQKITIEQRVTKPSHNQKNAAKKQEQKQASSLAAANNNNASTNNSCFLLPFILVLSISARISSCIVF
jgi:hypothetical protein